MKLTKEECEKALDDIKVDGISYCIDFCSNKDGAIEKRKLHFEGLKTIEQLIKEYFDNPPLKFEEIEKGMWVWNERDKEYVKVYKKYIADNHNGCYVKGTKVIQFIYPNDFTFSQEYKENEIYKKQVDENE